MPGTTTTTISSEQRFGIYTVVRNHLGGLNDVWASEKVVPLLAEAVISPPPP